MSEIEEFLRRAAAMRAQQAQQAQQGQPAQPTGPRTPRKVQPAITRPSMPSAEIMDAEVIEAEPVSGDDVARDVERHLDTRRFQHRAQHLAANIRAADEVIEARLHEAFEHRLGQLGASTTAAEDSILDEEESNAARAKEATQSHIDVRALLRSPQDIRNAIIMTELLNPPQHRW